MTEAEWLACGDPEAMLPVVQGEISDRRLRLFALSCVLGIRQFLYDNRSNSAVEVLERHLNGECSSADLYRAWHVALNAESFSIRDANEQRSHYVSMYAADAIVQAISWNPQENISKVSRLCRQAIEASVEALHQPRVKQSEQIRQVRLIHDIFGNPFHPVTLDPNWRTSSVVAMAAQMYESRDFAAMPILADALQDAGCDNADILDHCRGPGPHVRGCWVVDLVLGKE